MTAPAARTEAPAVPTPRLPSEPVRRPLREHPRTEYWDVRRARWVNAGR
jgi:hypothetical protein